MIMPEVEKPENMSEEEFNAFLEERNKTIPKITPKEPGDTDKQWMARQTQEWLVWHREEDHRTEYAAARKQIIEMMNMIISGPFIQMCNNIIADDEEAVQDKLFKGMGLAIAAIEAMLGIKDKYAGSVHTIDDNTNMSFPVDADKYYEYYYTTEAETKKDE